MCGVSEQFTSRLPLNSSLIANALVPWEPTAISAATRPTSSPPPMCSPPSTQPALAPIHPHHPKPLLHLSPFSTAPSATTTVPPSPSRCPSSTPPPASCAVAAAPTPPTVTTSPSAPHRRPTSQSTACATSATASCRCPRRRSWRPCRRRRVMIQVTMQVTTERRLVTTQRRQWTKQSRFRGSLF